MAFDGRRIPYGDRTFDAVMFVDVLHHIENQLELLSEARRVARQALVIKDHTREGVLDEATLRLMDYIGNARHGVALPYNYWTTHQWREAFEQLNLRLDSWSHEIDLYPWPANYFFGRRLHFIAKLFPMQMGLSL